MNPDKFSPDEIEMRLTALLLGELPADEATALRRAIEQDAELAQRHERIKRTIEFTRDAMATPAAPAAAPTPTLKLSEERRQQLLARFKMTSPKVATPEEMGVKRFQFSRLLELAVVVTVVALLVAISLPNFIKARSTSASNSLINNLRQVDGAKSEWALENHKSPNDTATMNDLKPYMRNIQPVLGEEYVPGKVSDPVTAEMDKSKAKQVPGVANELAGNKEQRVRIDINGRLVAKNDQAKQLAMNAAIMDKNMAQAAPRSQAEPVPSARKAAMAQQATKASVSRPDRSAGTGGVYSANVVGYSTISAESQTLTVAGPTTPIVLPPAETVNTGPVANGEINGDIALATKKGETIDRIRRDNDLNFFITNGTIDETPTLAFNEPRKPVMDSFDDITVSGEAPPQPAPSGSFQKSDGFNFGVPANKDDEALDTKSQAALFGVPAPNLAPKSPAPHSFDTVSESASQDARLLSPRQSSSQPSSQSSDGWHRPPHATPIPGVVPPPPPEVNFGATVAAETGPTGSMQLPSPESSGPGIAVEMPSTISAPSAAPAPVMPVQKPVVVAKSKNREISKLALKEHEITAGLRGGETETVSSYNGVVSGVTDLRRITNSGAVTPTSGPGNWGGSGGAGGRYSVSENTREKLAEEDKPLPKVTVPQPVPQPEIQTAVNAFSTFSLNVSDVSFKLAEASLEKGQMPDAASIRSEEFINAFNYRDPEAPAGVPVAFHADRARYPFAHNRDLLRFSIKTAAQGRQAGRSLNLVLLLDKSGSMERADRVEIVRKALAVLAAQLQANDTVSVVTFARTPRLWADGVPGKQAGDALGQVGGITPEGGTNLEEAMNLAYQTALRHYLPNGVNRVVLLTDGAANLGNVNPDALKQKVESFRKQGVALDCFGIGWEDYNDNLLEMLSRNGDGRYGFINTPEEAAAGFASQLAGALKIAAADVKVQVEFNPKRVTSYRQVGYAKHQLTKQQFRDNTVDAAEIAAQEAGNALYTVEVNPAGTGPIATVHVRYKVPGTTDYREQAWDVPFTGPAPALEQAGPAMRLAATASAFSEWLATSPYAQDVTPDQLLNYLRGVPQVYGADNRPKQLETMIREAKSISGK